MTGKRRTIDLDAARVARAEETGGTFDVVLGGETFELPAEMPLEVATRFSTGDLRGACEILVGPDQVEAFMSTGLSDKDLEALVEQGYGLTSPE